MDRSTLEQVNGKKMGKKIKQQKNVELVGNVNT